MARHAPDAHGVSKVTGIIDLWVLLRELGGFDQRTVIAGLAHLEQRDKRLGMKHAVRIGRHINLGSGRKKRPSSNGYAPRRSRHCRPIAGGKSPAVSRGDLIGSSPVIEHQDALHSARARRGLIATSALDTIRPEIGPRRSHTL